MRRLHYQFTIGQLLGLVALAAVLASVFAQFNWMFGLACTIAAVGFLMDRAKGRSGVVGAMMFGTLGFAAFGLVLHTLDSYTGQQHMLGDRPSTYILFYGGLGLLCGMIVGFGAWAMVVLFLLAKEVWARSSEASGPDPAPVETSGPASGRSTARRSDWPDRLTRSVQ